MVVRVSSVPTKARPAELRIGPDKVFRESVAPQYLAQDGAWNKRQTLIALESGVVVESVERVGQSHIVSVGEVVPQALLRGGAQVHCSRLKHSVESRPYWSKTSSADIDAVEHPIQQRRFPARSSSVECFLQTIRHEVRYIQVYRVVILPRQGAD